MKNRKDMLYVGVSIALVFAVEAVYALSNQSAIVLCLAVAASALGMLLVIVFADQELNRFPILRRFELLAQRVADAMAPGTGSKFFVAAWIPLLINVLCDYKFISSEHSQLLEFGLTLSAIIVSILGLITLKIIGPRLLKEHVCRSVELVLSCSEGILGLASWFGLVVWIIGFPATWDLVGSLRTILLFVFLGFWTLHATAPFSQYKRIAAKKLYLEQQFTRWKKRSTLNQQLVFSAAELPDLAQPDADIEAVLQQVKITIEELIEQPASGGGTESRERALEQKLDEVILRLQLAMLVPK